MSGASNGTITKIQQDRGRVLILSEDEARLVTGFGKRAGLENQTSPSADLARLSDELAAQVGSRHPGVAVRVFVVTTNGVLAGSLLTEFTQLVFVAGPHPRIAPCLQTDVNVSARYQTILAALVHRIAASDRDELTKVLREKLVQAAEALDLVSISASSNDAKVPEELPQVQFFNPVTARRGHRDLAGQLLASYTSTGPSLISYSGRHAIPSRRMVVRITDAFPPLLFPGYHGLRVTSRWFPGFVRGRVAWLRKNLGKQITRALRFNAENELAGEYRRWGYEKADALLAALPRIRLVLERDVAAAFGADPAVFEHHEIVASYPGVYAVAIHRLAHELEVNGVPFIPRMMSEHAHSKTGIDIHPGATIGPGFFVDHGTGVVIGQTTTIGENVTLYQSVTLGAFSFPRDETGALVRGAKRHPTLENGTVVYANASILGGDTVIGHHSAVGANVSQVSSLPPETVVYREKQHVVVRSRRPPTQQPTDDNADPLWVMD